MYIPRIYMDIHGISIDVYPWYIRGISMDIHRFLNPDFSAGPCCWSHSKVGTDGAEPSSLRLVRSVTYSRTSRRRKSVRHGLAGEDRLSPVTPVRRMRVFLQELLHVPGSIHQVNQVQVLDLYRFHGALLHIICKAQIHVFAEVGKAVCKTGHN
jgi:hypothetical protein